MRYQDGVSGTVRWYCKQPAQGSCGLHPLFRAGRIPGDTGQCIDFAETAECELRGLPASAKFTCQHLSDRNPEPPKLLPDLARLNPPILVEVALRLAALQVNRRGLWEGRASICMPEIDHIAAFLERAHQCY